MRSEFGTRVVGVETLRPPSVLFSLAELLGVPSALHSTLDFPLRTGQSTQILVEHGIHEHSEQTSEQGRGTRVRRLRRVPIPSSLLRRLRMR